MSRISGIVVAVAMIVAGILNSTPAGAKPPKSSTVAVTGGTPKGEQVNDATADFHWSWTLPAGQSIEIKGVNGNIRAEAATGSKVEVIATKHAVHSDPDEVKIEAFEHSGGVTVCAVYPSDGGRPNDCVAGPGGHSHTHNNDVVVDFRVLVPKGIDFVGRTVNGEVSAEKMPASAQVYTVNGSIRASAAGTVEAETVNGSIIAAMGSTTWKDGLEFSTVNGSITLQLPPKFDADLSVATLNGEIDTDFPFQVTGKIRRNKLVGTVGKGGPDLSLETVNGDIRLRAASY